ncbi:MAG: hypothetical protein Q9169_007339 [Polycauliona sp. 2 TL-2023]
MRTTSWWILLLPLACIIHVFQASQSPTIGSSTETTPASCPSHHIPTHDSNTDSSTFPTLRQNTAPNNPDYIQRLGEYLSQTPEKSLGSRVKVVGYLSRTSRFLKAVRELETEYQRSESAHHYPQSSSSSPSLTLSRILPAQERAEMAARRAGIPLQEVPSVAQFLEPCIRFMDKHLEPVVAEIR